MPQIGDPDRAEHDIGRSGFSLRWEFDSLFEIEGLFIVETGNILLERLSSDQMSRFRILFAFLYRTFSTTSGL
jgi:hypothetical protein